MNDETVCVSVDADLYNAAREILEELNSTPEAYLRMCYEESVHRKDEILARYRQGTEPLTLLSEIADIVLALLEKEALHGSAEH